MGYRLLDARTGRRSTVLATNIDFAAWGDYLGEPPLAAAFLDWLVDGAVILKVSGRSYRAHRARPVPYPRPAGRDRHYFPCPPSPPSPIRKYGSIFYFIFGMLRFNRWYSSRLNRT